MKVLETKSFKASAVKIGRSARKGTPSVTIDGITSYLSDKVVEEINKSTEVDFNLVEYTEDANGQPLENPFKRWEFAGAISMESVISQKKFDLQMQALEKFDASTIDVSKLVAL